MLEDSGLSLGLIPNNLLTNKNIWILFYAMTKNQILTKTYIQNPCGDGKFRLYISIKKLFY